MITLHGHNDRPLENVHFYHTPWCDRCRQFWGSLPLACWLQEGPPELLPPEFECSSPMLFVGIRQCRKAKLPQNRRVYRRCVTVNPAQKTSTSEGLFTCRMVWDQPTCTAGTTSALICNNKLLHQLSEMSLRGEKESWIVYLNSWTHFVILSLLIQDLGLFFWKVYKFLN